MTDIGDAIKRHEGCNMYGWLQVRRASGHAMSLARAARSC